MIQYLIETSVIIHYLRGSPSIVDYLNQLEGELCSSFICYAELYEGVVRVRESAMREANVRDFFHGLSEVFGLDTQIAQQFGIVRAHLKKKGMVIEDLDIIIAATCLAHRLTLVTLNMKHFSRVENLSLITPMKVVD